MPSFSLIIASIHLLAQCGIIRLLLLLLFHLLARQLLFYWCQFYKGSWLIFAYNDQARTDCWIDYVLIKWSIRFFKYCNAKSNWKQSNLPAWQQTLFWCEEWALSPQSNEWLGLGGLETWLCSSTHWLMNFLHRPQPCSCPSAEAQLMCCNRSSIAGRCSRRRSCNGLMTNRIIEEASHINDDHSLFFSSRRVIDCYIFLFVFLFIYASGRERNSSSLCRRWRWETYSISTTILISTTASCKNSGCWPLLRRLDSPIDCCLFLEFNWVVGL